MATLAELVRNNPVVLQTSRDNPSSAALVLWIAAARVSGPSVQGDIYPTAVQQSLDIDKIRRFGGTKRQKVQQTPAQELLKSSKEAALYDGLAERNAGSIVTLAEMRQARADFVENKRDMRKERKKIMSTNNIFSKTSPRYAERKISGTRTSNIQDVYKTLDEAAHRLNKAVDRWLGSGSLDAESVNTRFVPVPRGQLSMEEMAKRADALRQINGKSSINGAKNAALVPQPFLDFVAGVRKIRAPHLTP